MSASTLTTADLPEGMRDALAKAVAPKPALVLTCAHGPACPACVLAAARVLIDADASLSRRTAQVYTG